MAKEQIIYGLLGEIAVSCGMAGTEWLAAEQVVHMIKKS